MANSFRSTRELTKGLRGTKDRFMYYESQYGSQEKMKDILVARDCTRATNSSNSDSSFEVMTVH